jgi:hypothetical protein
MRQRIGEGTPSEDKTLTIKEVGHLIKRKCKRSIFRWLRNRSVSVYKDTKEAYVFRIEFDVQMDIEYVKSLRVKHPFKWKQMYKATCSDEALYNLMMIHMEEEPVFTQVTDVALKSKDDEKIFKRLSS